MEFNQGDKVNRDRVLPTNRLSNINRRLSSFQAPTAFSWQTVNDQRRVNLYDDEPVYGRLLINNAVRFVDLIIAILQREFMELAPALPRIDFNELNQYIRHHFPQFIKNNFGRLYNYVIRSKKPKTLQGRDALLDLDLLQFKQNSPLDDTDTDDAISLGASTLGTSGTDNMKTAELEAELNRIKESMASVYETRLTEMQETLQKQAKAQAEMEAKMNAMMEQMQVSQSTPLPAARSLPQKPSDSSIPNAPPLPPVLSTPKVVPQAPPLPTNTSTFGQDRANLMESIRSTGDFASSGLKSADSKSLTELQTSKENINADDPPKAYDYRTELAAQLQKRRQAIEKNENYDFVDVVERSKRVIVNPVASTLLNTVPAPTASPGSARFGISHSSSCCTDEDDWS